MERVPEAESDAYFYSRPRRVCGGRWLCWEGCKLAVGGGLGVAHPLRSNRPCRSQAPANHPASLHSLPSPPACRRGHQIGALVSMQSVPLAHGRRELEERAARLEAQYADESVPVS